MRFAEIAVDAPAGYDRTFSYSVPLAFDLKPGHLVKVPFGSRTLQGVVFELADAPQVPETRDVLEVSQPEPVLDQNQISRHRHARSNSCLELIRELRLRARLRLRWSVTAAVCDSRNPTMSSANRPLCLIRVMCDRNSVCCPIGLPAL